MAYKPSKRRKSDELDMELDIRPVMNLMVVLIPLLIASAEWVKLGVIEVNVPPAKTNINQGPGDEDQADAQEKELKLGLVIAISQEGFTIGNALTLIEGENSEGPTVPRKDDGEFDYPVLREKLIEIKNLIADKGYKDTERAVLSASADIEYQVIIDVMDNIQTYEDANQDILPLFPEINFGKIL